MVNSDSSAGRILEFWGDVGKHSAVPERGGVPCHLSAPRVLAALRRDAREATRDSSPENIRQEGTAGLTKLLEFLDARYVWQLESLLYEAMEAYLYFAARRMANESVTGLLARYSSALARVQQITNEHRETEAKARRTREMGQFQRVQLSWLA